MQLGFGEFQNRIDRQLPEARLMRAGSAETGAAGNIELNNRIKAFIRAGLDRAGGTEQRHQRTAEH